MRGFMAVTAHWIQEEIIQSINGTQPGILTLRSALIGFHRVPGAHSGEHLAAALLFVIDRIGIAKLVSIDHSFCFQRFPKLRISLVGLRWTTQSQMII